MKSAITNRYDFVLLFDVQFGNPNGDPDAANAPRVDPETMVGLVSDVCIKRQVRNYVSVVHGDKAPNRIFVQSGVNLNRFIAEGHIQANGKLPGDSEEEPSGEAPSSGEDTPAETPAPKKKAKKTPPAARATRAEVGAARDWMCANFFDIRAFGAVLSTGANAGQVRGPVQVTFAQSVEPIFPLEVTITRMASAEKVPGAKSLQDFEAFEDTAEKVFRTMGRKNVVPYGLYLAKGFISANVAQDTGFSEDDLQTLFRALHEMWDFSRSASRGLMATRELIVFRHDGLGPEGSEHKKNSAMLGCAPAHELFDLVKVRRRTEGPARNYEDYVVEVSKTLPKGVSLLQGD